MTSFKKNAMLQIAAKKWFDGNNTYFRAHIQLNNKTLVILPFQYGYGDYYMQAANEWLHVNNYINNPKNKNTGSQEPLWYFCNKHNIKLSYSSYYVKTKKQCMNETF